LLNHFPQWQAEQFQTIAHSLSPIGCSFYVKLEEELFFLKYTRDSTYYQRTEAISKTLLGSAPGIVPRLTMTPGHGVLIYEYITPLNIPTFNITSIRPVIDALISFHSCTQEQAQTHMRFLNKNSMTETVFDLLRQSKAQNIKSSPYFDDPELIQNALAIFDLIEAKATQIASDISDIEEREDVKVLSHGDINVGNLLSQDERIIFTDLEHVGLRYRSDDLAQTILMLEQTSLKNIREIIKIYLESTNIRQTTNQEAFFQLVSRKLIIASAYQNLCMLIYYLSLKGLGCHFEQDLSPPLLTKSVKEARAPVMPGKWKTHRNLPELIAQQSQRLHGLCSMYQ
jgi:hypothetical protein